MSVNEVTPNTPSTDRRTLLGAGLGLGASLAAASGLTPLASWAQTPGRQLIADPDQGWSPEGDRPPGEVSVTTVPITDGPAGHTRASRFTIGSDPVNDYLDGEYSIVRKNPTTAPTQAGNQVSNRMWIRSTATENGHRLTMFLLQLDRTPWRNVATALLKLTPDWQLFEFGVTVRPISYTDADGNQVVLTEFQPGELAAKFWLGYGKQTFEVAGLEIVDHGTQAPPDFPPTTYAGRAADADWREAAAERIEQYRKGDLVITVTDANGQPIPDAEVSVEHVRHTYRFGHAVGARLLMEETKNREPYRNAVLATANQVTLDNDLKMGPWQDLEYRNTYTLPAIEWLQENNVALRGHNLVWPSFKRSPARLAKLSPTQLRAELRRHVNDEASALRRQVVSWDVVNEWYAEHTITDLLGTEELAHWFRIADASDPRSRKLLNEAGSLRNHTWNTRQTELTFNLIRRLRSAGAPIHGIGLESHIRELQPTAPAAMKNLLDRFLALSKELGGFDVEITEFDFDTADQELQADYTRDFLTMAFSHPVVTAISTWGLWAGRYAIPNAAMYDLEWKLKPNGREWQRLINSEWRTNAQLRTSGQGRATVRGFHGHYDLKVTAGGRTVNQQISHTSRDQTKVSITVK